MRAVRAAEAIQPTGDSQTRSLIVNRLVDLDPYRFFAMLPDRLWLQIITEAGLSISDIAQLYRVNNDMNAMLTRIHRQLWRRLIERDLFTPFPLCHILIDAWNDSSLTKLLSEQFPEPEDWKRIYMDTLLSYRLETMQLSDSNRSNSDLRLQECREAIMKGKMADSKIVCAIISILQNDPSYVPAYHLLASLCYARNYLHAALQIIDAGQRVHLALNGDADGECRGQSNEEMSDDDDNGDDGLFGPLEELRCEIVDRLSGKSPLLVLLPNSGEKEYEANDTSVVSLEEDGKEAYGLSPRLESLLTDVFNRFDSDCDGYLNYDEMAALLTAINGSAPVSQSFRPPPVSKAAPRAAKPVRKVCKYLPLPTFLQLIKHYRYGEETVSGLSLYGFLAFYLDQTSQDEVETLRDLSQLGYNVQEIFML
jgi:hypothetical protein